MLLIFALLATIFVGCLYAYVQVKIVAMRDDTADALAAVSEARLDQGKETELINLYQSRASDWARIQTFFVSNDRPLSFIESLEALGKAASSSLVISSISSDSGNAKSSVRTGTVSAHIEATGSWNSLMRTLKLVEVMPFQINIDHVRFDTSVLEGETASKHSWKLGFDIKAATFASSSLASDTTK